MKTLTRIVSTAALATALATAGCNRSPDAAAGNTQAIALPMLPATLPLEARESNPISFAPSASDLPDAPELKLARVADPNQAYGYADAAYSYDNALGDAPPDYAFDYEDVDPWAWQGYDNSVMIAEPIDDGYRYYYYRPGAEQPYFVRDPWYSYGYSDGLLAAVYAADGGIVAYGDYGPRAIYASRYYSRGRQLWGASRQGRRPVVASAWLRRGPVIAASLARWGEGRSRQPAWRAFAASDGPRQAQYWQAERTRRDADSRRFADWKQSGFRAAPPPRAIPAAWQAASWAKDQKRYRAVAATGQRGERGNGRGDGGRVDRSDDRQQDVGRQERREEAQAARAERREDRQPQPGKRPDRQGDQRGEQAQRPDRVERQQAQAERRAERAEGRPAGRVDRRETPRPDRQPFERPERPERQRPERQVERPDRPQFQRPERQQPDRAQRQQRDDGERMQRQQAAQAQRQAEQAQRQQAVQAQRQAAQAQQRQAEQAQRQQQMQAQRQAEQAQRQQAVQAQRQQQQQQRQEQRQEQRQDRRENRENRRAPN